jgi:hypothetical protein
MGNIVAFILGLVLLYTALIVLPIVLANSLAAATKSTTTAGKSDNQQILINIYVIFFIH